MIHMRQKGDQFADMHLLAEKHLIQRRRDDITFTVFSRTGIRHLIQHFQQRTAVDMTGEIGHIGRHQDGHGEVLFLFEHKIIMIVVIWGKNLTPAEISLSIDLIHLFTRTFELVNRI